MNSSLPIRDVIAHLPPSDIREVANVGMGVKGVLPFWFGESDQPTPEHTRAAAIASLQAGDTYYSHNLGIIELREAISAYSTKLHTKPVAVDRIAVTSSGDMALMLTCEILVNPGDEVVAVTPVWPNLVHQSRILGGNVKEVSLQPKDGRWQLDMNALHSAISSKTKLLIVNSPNNPTGWTLTQQEQQDILDLCRKTGTWILSDEVYERLYYVDGAKAAPSFLNIADEDDRVIVVQSFSKSFLMTGWRLGWLTVPKGLAHIVGVVTEYNTSCAPVFIQKAGIAALSRADETVPALCQEFKSGRDVLIRELQSIPGLELQSPDGAMYAFFRIPQYGDSLALAKRLVVEAKLGLAPGSAFGHEARNWLRWCFASKDQNRLIEGVARLKKFLGV